MIDKEKFNKNFFLCNNWLQLVVKIPSSLYEKRLKEIAGFLHILQQKHKIKNWFFLNKKGKVLFKIEIVKKYKNETTDLLSSLLNNKEIKIDIFEPEIFQFGGEVGWKITKKYFNKMSYLIVQNKKKSCKKDFLALIIIFDLFLGATNDSWEAWDILQRLTKIRKNNEAKKIKNNKFYKHTALILTEPKNFYFKETQNLKLIKEIININLTLIKDLEKNKFDLLFSKRKILPYHAIFIFNMLLVSPKQQEEIIDALNYFFNQNKYDL